MPAGLVIEIALTNRKKRWTADSKAATATLHRRGMKGVIRTGENRACP
jgi:hypothetical protein